MEKYDIVIFGASGFTGQYVVSELATVQAKGNVGKKFTWAVSGRSMAKLQTVLKQASSSTGIDLSEVPIIIADSNNEKSLEELCQRCQILLNCVGPYRFYGTAVVKACIENKCHHIDICGEPGWLENIQLVYGPKAREAGVFVLQACGFDSMPCEMGLLYTKKQHDGDINATECFIAARFGEAGGHGNYATWQSAIHSFVNQRELRGIRRQLFSKPFPKSNHRITQRKPIFYSDDVQNWCVPFPGADRSVAQRSMFYNYMEKHQRPIQLQMYYRCEGLLHLFRLLFVSIMFLIFTKFAFGISLLEKFPRFMSAGLFSSRGPTKKQIDQASFDITFVSQAYNSRIDDPEQQHDDKPSKKIITRVSGPEAGYVTTPICAVQAARVLLEERDKMPTQGGVYTPGAAFAGTSLISRLEERGLRFTAVEK